MLPSYWDKLPGHGETATSHTSISENHLTHPITLVPIIPQHSRHSLTVADDKGCTWSIGLNFKDIYFCLIYWSNQIIYPCLVRVSIKHSPQSKIVLTKSEEEAKTQVSGVYSKLLWRTSRWAEIYECVYLWNGFKNIEDLISFNQFWWYSRIHLLCVLYLTFAFTLRLPDSDVVISNLTSHLYTCNN